MELSKNATPFKMASTISDSFSGMHVFGLLNCFSYIFVSSVQMSIFGAYMAKYFYRQRHQLSRLSHFREGSRALYNKVLVESRVLELEKALL